MFDKVLKTFLCPIVLTTDFELVFVHKERPAWKPSTDLRLKCGDD